MEVISYNFPIKECAVTGKGIYVIIAFPFYTNVQLLAQGYVITINILTF